MWNLVAIPNSDSTRPWQTLTDLVEPGILRGLRNLVSLVHPCEPSGKAAAAIPQGILQRMARRFPLGVPPCNPLGLRPGHPRGSPSAFRIAAGGPQGILDG